MRKIDLTNQRFGKLIVLSLPPEKDKRKELIWTCICNCGNISKVLSSNLRSGHTTSCGCNKKILKHGLSHSKTYAVWEGIIARCKNKNDTGYGYYGGRGINVCEKWLNFENFLKDMGERPYEKTIERIDNNGDYCPENCKWATWEEQCINRRGKGYSWNKSKKKWRAQIMINYKQYHLGYFNTNQEAQNVYVKAKRERAQCSV